MTEQKFPPGWDEARVKKLIAHCDQMDEDIMVAEDEAAQEMSGQTLMIVPTDLVAEVRKLIVRKTGA